MKRKEEPKYKYNPLRGHMALAACGVPAEFASRCMLLLNKYQITAAWRIGDTNDLQPEAMTSTTKTHLARAQASHPKPADVKEKSSNWGFTKWFIADDPRLGKYDHDNPVNTGIKRSKRVEAMEHFVTLRFILSGINKKPSTMQFISYNHDELMIRCLDAPQGAPDIFRIRLDKSQSPNIVDPSLFLVVPDSSHNKPEWWPDQYHFADMLDRRFPVEVKAIDDNQFKSVKVLGIRDIETKQLTPIITDMDLLWLSTPNDDIPMVQLTRDININIFEVLNTFVASDANKLRNILEKLVAIDDEIFRINPENKDRLDLKNVDDETLARMGCVTPFIAYFILVVNQHFGAGIEHLQDLMQHAPEIFNPNKPSTLGTTLNITGGEILETLCEDDQILYAMGLIQDGYQIQFHPQWDMSKWGKAIALSIDQEHIISRDVLSAYIQFKDNEEAPILVNPAASLKPFSRKDSQAIMPFLRKKSSASSPQTLHRKDSAGIYIVQIYCPDIDAMNPKSSLIEKFKINLLSDLCHEQNNLSSFFTWKLVIKNFLVIEACDDNGTFNMCEFRIDANRISLVSGEVTEFSLTILKQLADKLFENKSFIILAKNPDIQEKSEKALLPQIPPKLN